MIPGKLEEITEVGLQALVDGGIREDRNLEYKREVPERDKLLKHVAAFANTDGGDLVLGVSCSDRGSGDGAAAKEVLGLELSNADATATSIEQRIRSGLEPALDAFRMRPVPLDSGRTVLVIRVYKSWQRPHRLDKSEKFYGRANHHVYTLSVPELRRAFAGGEGRTDRVRRFVADRLIAIRAGETPVPCAGATFLVLHLIPLGALQPGPEPPWLGQLESTPFAPMEQTRVPGRPTLEGWVWWSPPLPSSSLVHAYHSGVVEAIDASLFVKEANGLPPALGEAFGETFSRALARYLGSLARLGMQPPLYLFLSLVGVRRHHMDLPGQSGTSPAPFNQDSLTLPEFVIDAFDTSVTELRDSLLRRLANACGTSY